jgi:hypothetical protein
MRRFVLHLRPCRGWAPERGAVGAWIRPGAARCRGPWSQSPRSRPGGTQAGKMTLGTAPAGWVSLPTVSSYAYPDLAVPAFTDLLARHFDADRLARPQESPAEISRCCSSARPGFSPATSRPSPAARGDHPERRPGMLTALLAADRHYKICLDGYWSSTGGRGSPRVGGFGYACAPPIGLQHGLHGGHGRRRPSFRWPASSSSSETSHGGWAPTGLEPRCAA